MKIKIDGPSSKLSNSNCAGVMNKMIKRKKDCKYETYPLIEMNLQIR